MSVQQAQQQILFLTRPQSRLTEILTSHTGTIAAPSLPYLHTLDWLDYIVGRYLC